MGISIYHGKSVEKEFLIPNFPECCPKGLDFGVERLCCCIRRPVVVEVEYVIIVFVERSRNNVEGMESSLFDLVVPFGHREPGSILDGVLGKDHPQ